MVILFLRMSPAFIGQANKTCSVPPPVGSLRVYKQFLSLKARSVKSALPRPNRHRVGR